MAEDAEIEEVEDPMTKVAKQAGLNRLLLIVALVLCLVLIGVMYFGMTTMQTRIAELQQTIEAEQEDTLDEQFLILEQKIMLLSDFRKSELKKIGQYTRELTKVSKDCNLDDSKPYQNFLSTREADFQALITAMKTGTKDLAGMNKGSKKWLESFNQSLDDLSKRSKERKKMLDELTKG